PGNPQVGKHAQNQVAVLIPGSDVDAEYAVGWLGTGWGNCEDLEFDANGIVGPHGIGPADFVDTQPEDGPAVERIGVDDKAHDGSCGLPTAGREASERSMGSGMGIEVHRLWIIVLGKTNDGSFGDVDGARRGDELANREIFEITHRVAIGGGYDC